MPIRLLPPGVIPPTAKRYMRVSFKGVLDGSELLTGAVTITEPTGNLTFTLATVSSTALVISDEDGQAETVAAGKAITAYVDATNAVIGTVYLLTISVASTSNPSQTVPYEWQFVCQKIQVKLPKISAGAKRIVSLSCANELDDGVLLDEDVDPVVTEVGTTDLTIDDEQVSTVDLTILNKNVDAGKAVQWTVAGAVAGGGDGDDGEYVLTIVVEDDQVPAQRLVYEGLMECE